MDAEEEEFNAEKQPQQVTTVRLPVEQWAIALANTASESSSSSSTGKPLTALPCSLPLSFPRISYFFDFYCLFPPLEKGIEARILVLEEVAKTLRAGVLEVTTKHTCPRSLFL